MVKVNAAYYLVCTARIAWSVVGYIRVLIVFLHDMIYWCEVSRTQDLVKKIAI